MALADLRAFYRLDEEVAVTDLPPGTERVVARPSAGGATRPAAPTGGVARIGPLRAGTYAVEARAADGRLLGEELTTVGTHAGERPVLGFATSFEEEHVAPVLDWLRALRCTVVQLYDWMATYTAPLGPATGWADPLGRPVSFRALHSLAEGIRATGAVAQAYAPVYAADPPFAAAHPELLLYRGDGEPERLGDLLQITDPGNPDWQRRFVETYGSAVERIGFDGFHLDTYGYPWAARDATGRRVDMRAAYTSFLRALRRERPTDLLSFNQVNGVPPALELPGGPGFRYVEVWPPNDRWRHFEGLLDRSRAAGNAGPIGGRDGPRLRGTLACYPPVWGGEREAALRTVVCTEAVATCLGASVLVFGDLRGASVTPTTRTTSGCRGTRRPPCCAGDASPSAVATCSSRARTRAGSSSATRTARSRRLEGSTGPEPLGGAVVRARRPRRRPRHCRRARSEREP